MEQTVDLSIVIVSWNTCGLLADCLVSIEQYPPHCSYEVWVVDNASTDGSAAMVRERFPWVRLVESQANLGFAGGNNLALRQARGAHVLLLNPDTVVTAGAMARLCDALAAQGAVGMVGGQLLNGDGSLQMSYGVFPSLWSELPLVNRWLRPIGGAMELDTADERLVVQAVDWVSGACLMVKRDVMEGIGLLDESFWLYTEETDWCYRARAAGWEVWLVPQAQVYHLARAASRQRFVATMLYFYQSRVRFVHKHHGALHASWMRDVLRVKAGIWRRRPSGSPLRGAYPDLGLEQVSLAYRQPSQALALPLGRFLAMKWL